ncbi:dihydrodipicolinate synthase family protein [Pseudonocardia nigra]|uniref:dihydrodipicolinate synthase family protein n=1 Tax=Pseudonocardia nigra TaxID=1921578 RepID=UPI001C5F9149
MTAGLLLPTADGIVRHELRAGPLPSPSAVPPRSRVAYAAAHVVADPAGDNAPDAPAVLDWDATLAFRHHLWSHGLGVADAMDTAQRGMGLDWAATAELVRRSAAEAAACGGALVSGAGTDHVAPRLGSLDEVVAAYEEQLEVVEGSGSGVVLMASRQLAALAAGPDDYRAVYGRLLAQVRRPVVLHWLGAVFDPQLAGYWGHADPADAVDTVAGLIAEHAGAIDGIKVSVLDAAIEVRLRNALPSGVRLYTGDDFHYPELIRGDDRGHSDALLGILAAIGPVAAAALRRLDDGDVDGYDALMEPTVALSRHLFSAPTPHYKTGIAFLAWLNGHQPGFTMVGGMQSARSLPHLAQTLRLADAAGALADPDLAARRWHQLLQVAGVTA